MFHLLGRVRAVHDAQAHHTGGITGLRATLALTASLLASGMPASAQTGTIADIATSSHDMTRRTRELIPILNGRGEPQRTFSKSFLTDVPEAMLRAIATSVVEQLGSATGILSITPRAANQADLLIAYEKGTAHALVVFAPGGRIGGFIIDEVERADIAALTTLDQVARAFARLPGAAAFLVTDIATGSEPQAALDPDRPLAIA
jgi:hypothetical protein